ncbi:hypothetical protein I3843_04G166000 [Carya illinoinensis]|nr:hypothetical protein I3843_04G166000 [Carya illinoinensis]
MALSHARHEERLRNGWVLDVNNFLRCPSRHSTILVGRRPKSPRRRRSGSSHGAHCPPTVSLTPSRLRSDKS